MATKTRAEMIDLTLERLGVKAATVAATAEQSTAAGRVLDSLHSRLRKEELAPFALALTEEWAWIPLADIAAYELAPDYRITGQALADLRANEQRGREELSRQTAGKKQPVKARLRFF